MYNISMYDILDHIRYIELELETLRGMVGPSGTGHIHTAISVLESRLYSLYLQLGIVDEDESAIGFYAPYIPLTAVGPVKVGP